MHGRSSCLGYLIDAYANAVAAADADLSHPTDSDDESDTSTRAPRCREKLAHRDRAQLAFTKCTHIVDSNPSPNYLLTFPSDDSLNPSRRSIYAAIYSTPPLRVLGPSRFASACPLKSLHEQTFHQFSYHLYNHYLSCRQA
jgi:hypothetical protein